MMTDRQASRVELHAALMFWAKYHTQGARNRVREAIAYVRQYR
jgi:hypothetical protein